MYDSPVRYRGILAISIAALITASLVASGASASTASCKRTYPDLIKTYKRLVTVYERRGLNCSQAAAVGSDVATRYERGLPTRDYPPPPTGVPGGKSQRFAVVTSAGRFTCRMTSRGSDFVAATCERAAKYVRFVSLNHYYIARTEIAGSPTIEPR
jgi:hypothetical protein